MSLQESGTLNSVFWIPQEYMPVVFELRRTVRTVRWESRLYVLKLAPQIGGLQKELIKEKREFHMLRIPAEAGKCPWTPFLTSVLICSKNIPFLPFFDIAIIIRLFKHHSSELLIAPGLRPGPFAGLPEMRRFLGEWAPMAHRKRLLRASHAFLMHPSHQPVNRFPNIK